MGFNSGFKGLMQAVQLRSQTMPCNFCGGQWSLAQDSSSVFHCISTTASHSSPSSYGSCQKDKRLKRRNLHVKQCYSVNRENWKLKYAVLW